MAENLHGFEIKTWRADWLQELKNPDKADNICSFCHFWYIAIDDEKIVKLDELPIDWGLMLCTKGTRKILKKAPERTNVTPLDIQMIAGILRKAADLIGPAGELKNAEDKGRKEAETRLQVSIDHYKYEREVLQQKVNDFETASGIKIDQYGKTGSEIGAAVKVVLEGCYDSYKHRLERTKNDLQRTVNDLSRVINELQRLDNTKEEPDARHLL